MSHPKDLSPDELKHLTELAAQWPHGWDPVILDDGSWTGMFESPSPDRENDPIEVDGSPDSDYPVHYASFVSKAVNALPRLLAEVARLRAAASEHEARMTLAVVAIALEDSRCLEESARIKYFKQTDAGSPAQDRAWAELRAYHEEVRQIEIAFNRALRDAIKLRDAAQNSPEAKP